MLWTPADGVTWQRMTAVQAGLGDGVRSISYAASSGQDTVVSGTLGDGAAGTWLSTGRGRVWTPVTVPATLGAAGGFTPQVVKGSAYGFAVTGTDADGNAVTGTDADGNYVACTAAGDGASWLPTGSLGTTSGYASAPAATVAPDGAVIAAGSIAASKTSQQAVLLRASTAGLVRPVPLASVTGVLQQIAVQGDRVVARGTQTRDGVTTPLAELSADDGATWRQVPAIR